MNQVAAVSVTEASIALEEHLRMKFRDGKAIPDDLWLLTPHIKPSAGHILTKREQQPVRIPEGA